MRQKRSQIQGSQKHVLNRFNPTQVGLTHLEIKGLTHLDPSLKSIKRSKLAP